MPEKDLCTAPDLTKTRGGGRLLCWPPRKPAHLGCSAATGHLCCQAGLSAALPRAVTSLQHALQHKVRLHWVSLGTKIRREGLSLSPFPRCFKRDLPPPNQLCDVDPTYELQTWVRTAVGNSQDILQCPRRWQKAELETTGEAQGTQQPAVRPSRVQRPQKCLAPSASAAGLQHGAGASRGFAGKNQARVTLTPCTCTRPRDPTTSPSGHRYHSIQKAAPPALTWS